MNCPTCSGWRARTEQQFQNRMHNISRHPALSVHECPTCHTIDWVYDDSLIAKLSMYDQINSRRSIWQRFKNWISY